VYANQKKRQKRRGAFKCKQQKKKKENGALWREMIRKDMAD